MKPFVASVQPHIRAVRTSVRPKIDSKLDDRGVDNSLDPVRNVHRSTAHAGGRAERAFCAARPLRRQGYLHRRRLRAGALARRQAAFVRRDHAVLPSDGIWLDIDSRRDNCRRLSLRRQRRGRAERRRPLPRSRLLRRLGRRLGRQGRRHAARLWSALPRPLYVLRFDALPSRTWGLEVRQFIEAQPGNRRLGLLLARRPPPHPALRAHRRSRQPAPAAELAVPPLRARTRAPPLRRRGREPGDAGARVGRRLLGGPRRQVLDHERADARSLRVAGLRAGRGGRRRPQPVHVRDLLPREAAVLPRGRRHLLDTAPSSFTRGASGTSRRRRRSAPGRRSSPRPSPLPATAPRSSTKTIGGRTTLGLLSAVTGRNDVDVLPPSPSGPPAPPAQHHRAAVRVQRPAAEAPRGRRLERGRARDGDDALRTALSPGSALSGDERRPGT